MYDSILFPTDGSEAAAEALDHAVDHARQYDATLHVLFVADEDFGPSGLVQGDHEGVEQSDMVGEDHDGQSSGMTHEGSDRVSELAEHGESVVDEVAAAAGDDVAVETAVLQGRPYERILDHCEDVDADLVVMGTHGRTGVDRYLLGSVTEKVVRTADAPVLTVRESET